MTASMTLVERLRASAFGADDPAKYIPRGISAADCIKAADAIETAEKALEEALAFVEQVEARENAHYLVGGHISDALATLRDNR